MRAEYSVKGVERLETNNQTLAHYGIKGQKWGVRRFQNEDRSLTAAGKARYGRGESKTGKLKEKAKEILKKTGQFAKQKVSKIQKNDREDLSQFSDQDLQRKLARLRMESEYNRLTNELKRGSNPNNNQNNQNNNNQAKQNKGNKSGKRHPYLAMALFTPVAAAIGAEVKKQTEEKIQDFMKKKAAKKVSEAIPNGAQKVAAWII